MVRSFNFILGLLTTLTPLELLAATNSCSSDFEQCRAACSGDDSGKGGEDFHFEPGVGVDLDLGITHTPITNPNESESECISRCQADRSTCCRVQEYCCQASSGKRCQETFAACMGGADNPQGPTPGGGLYVIPGGEYENPGWFPEPTEPGVIDRILEIVQCVGADGVWGEGGAGGLSWELGNCTVDFGLECAPGSIGLRCRVGWTF